MMESLQITSYHCFTASCKEQHITHHTSGTAKPHPEHEAHNLLTVEQGKSHSHAVPQSKIQDITTVVSEGLESYVELGPLNLCKSVFPCDWYKLRYVDNYIYVFLHIYTLGEISSRNLCF